MKKLMAANWKMYKTRAEAAATARELVSLLEGKLPEDREVLVCAPFTCLGEVGAVFEGRPRYFVGGENFYPADEGAFTGEISPGMLTDSGCAFALAGHSERRHVMGESDAFVGQKVAYGVARGLRVVLCIGETIEERKAGRVEEVLERQLRAGLSGLSADDLAYSIAVAYEPVWAIGTGEVAGPVEIAHAHAFTRKILRAIVGDKGSEVRILYGGSVKPGNASEILSVDNVDGVLVGGASLSGESFSKIVLA